jgi:CheY-like chemotaxis protein
MPHRARVLVIDDDPLFRSLIVSLLRKDYIVSVASEGSEGFYKALEHPPDIAIVDIQMPGWDGLKTLKSFRGHPALNQVKIVILTTDASKGTVVAAIQSGANDYVIKTSFSKQEFYDKLNRLLPMAGRRTAQLADTKPGGLPAQRDAESPSPDSSESAPCAVSDWSDFTEEEQLRLQEIIDGWE